MDKKQYSRKCPECKTDVFHMELNNCNYAHINTLNPKLFWRFNKKENIFYECINGKNINTINTKQGETRDGRLIKRK
jgi:hypothetical protein